MLLLTDGNSNNIKDTMSEAFLLKQCGVHVIVIAVSDWINEDELQNIASFPHEINYFLLEHFNELDNLVDQIRNLVCNSK